MPPRIMRSHYDGATRASLPTRKTETRRTLRSRAPAAADSTADPDGSAVFFSRAAGSELSLYLETELCYNIDIMVKYPDFPG